MGRLNCYNIETHQDLFNAMVENTISLIAEFSGGVDYDHLKEWAEGYAVLHGLAMPEIDWGIYIIPEY